MQSSFLFGAITSLVICILSAHLSLAGPKDFYYQKWLQKTASPLNLQELTADVATAQEGSIQTRINPADPHDPRTFTQRYFINSQYASGPNAPVIYVICGEATCSAGELGGAVLSMAQAFKAHRVALEHRYYGLSQPFAKLTAVNMQYLTTANALSDLASFQTYAMDKLSLKGKWIVVGGSYAGALSAYYRLSFPQLVHGSLASSGPVRARDNFEEYDFMVSKAAGTRCRALMQSVVNQMDKAFDNDVEFSKIRTIFKSEQIRDKVDVLYVMADMAAYAIQYGFRDEFCNALLAGSKKGDTLTAYAQKGLEMLARFGVDPLMDSFQGAESEDPKDYVNSFGMRQWLYQDCTEYGFWQVAYHDPAIAVRSQRINLAYHNYVCKRMFGIEQPVDVSKINNSLYRHLLNPARASQILYTQGSTDPWSTLGIAQQNGNATNPNTNAVTIEGAAHCDDLRSPSSTESASMHATRVATGKLIANWIAN